MPGRRYCNAYLVVKMYLEKDSVYLVMRMYLAEDGVCLAERIYGTLRGESTLHKLLYT
jgi:hypothetical protein